MEREEMPEGGYVPDPARLIGNTLPVPIDVLDAWISPFRVEAVSRANSRLLFGETGSLA